MTDRIRVIGTLKGDIQNMPADRIKYGLMFESLGKYVDLLEVYDTSLRGSSQIINAARVFHFDRHRWRQRYYKNVPAFRARSRQTTAYLKSRYQSFDLIFQVGVLYDPRWQNQGRPSVIYTDYTSWLSRQKQDMGRSPFTNAEYEAWFALEKQAFEHSSHIFTRAAYVHDSVIQDYEIPAEKVTAVGSGLNFQELLNSKTKESIEEPVLLFIGKDFYRKGADMLLKAFAAARRIVPEMRLKMITQAPPDFDLPLDGVEMIAPTWDRAVIDHHFQEANVFILPSRLETWGDVLLEAMAYGMPCIGVSGEAMGEIIAHEETGLVVPPKDEAALAQAIVRLAQDKRLRTQWGQAGRRRVEERFTWAGIIEKMLPILTSISQGKHQSTQSTQ